MMNLMASKRSCKLLQCVGFSSGKVANRRLTSQLMCRLPLLTIWTLIVIFLLYKSISDSSSIEDTQDEKQLLATLRASNDQQDEQVANKGREMEILNDEPVKSVNTNEKTLDYETNVINNYPQAKQLYNAHLKSENVRQSKVFILIMQNENLQLTSQIHPPNGRKKSDHYLSSHFVESFTNNRKHQKSVIPQHIKILIEILEAHRIEYNIDSTRTGLPTTLLTDNSSEIRQYSVIVIDDFIKYTKLSRWVRDQLDRHCRTNQVGVITFLTSSSLENTTSNQNRAHPKADSRGHIISRRHGHSTTEESLADQFPLIFKSNDNNYRQNSSLPYLVDYQLNERSQILRTLKRRQNFIIHGPLIANINQLPWTSMSSDHVTYEPLTWVREKTNSDPKSPVLAAADTQEMNHFHSSLGDVSQMGGDSSSDPKSENIYEAKRDTSDGAIQDKDILMRHYDNESENANANASIHETSSFVDHNFTNNHEDIDKRLVLSMFDRGLYDGIKRVIFGGANHHWMNRVLLLDAIEHLSSGRILNSLARYIQIDIDDIFVGERGKRMNSKDVEALIDFQRKLSRKIEGGFKFNLGFSGKYYKHGHDDENVGDEQLVANAKEFTWFCHTWSHSKAHLMNETEAIATELRRNLEFARERKLPIVGQAGLVTDSKEPLRPTYTVAPHHSGVYPVHEQLYDAWKSVLNVQVTSTEEYPHLRPASGRRGFVHKAIKVLPRQTCGLYSHTIYKRKYPGGMRKLDSIIRGGELFETILHNPVNIFMTHMSNYANDQLALYTFSELLEFVEMNTNIQLKYSASSPSTHDAPLKLAEYYFDMYPNEKQPLWTNPCSDKRHLSIWGLQKRTKYCSIVPKLLIVGPQKTGTTALHTFLKMNPIFKSSLISAPDFEEIQFFNDKHYYKGVDWYFDKFSTFGNGNNNNGSNSENYFFDKSATYFDDPKVAQRAANLLPAARIVILLINPADRAYSWYQHIKAHGDLVANSLTFEQVIMYNDDKLINNFDQVSNNISYSIRSLRNRCLHPGYYSQHLNKWLMFYPSKQIIIIDGQWFKHNPASVMNRLQLLLHASQTLDYNQLLVYDEEKGFYCQLKQSNVGISGKVLMDQADNKYSGKQVVECLGKNKGRKYPPMSVDARKYLNRHYWPHNRQLAQILSEIGQPLPTWLDETMTLANVRSVM